jgi:peptidoglycan/LPS O-acetylase OafA/YrhL
MIAAALLQEWGEATRFTMSLANFIQFFLAGFLLADFYLIDWNERPTRSTLWDLLGVLSFALLLVNLNRNDYVFTRLELPLRLFSPFLILGLYCAILRGPMLNWTFTRPLLTTIGGMCYTIYLLHNTVLAAVGRYTWSLGEGKSFNTQLLIQHAVMIPPILVVSAVFFLLVEKPFMRADWLQRLKGRWGKPLPAAQEARSTE